MYLLYKAMAYINIKKLIINTKHLTLDINQDINVYPFNTSQKVGGNQL